MRSKAIRKKGKRKPKETGEPVNHKQIHGVGKRNSIKAIRGIYKAWLKSPKFLLRMDAELDQRMYLGRKNNLVTKKDEARRFAIGFDDAEKQINFWSAKLRVKFLVERVGHDDKEKGEVQDKVLSKQNGKRQA